MHKFVRATFDENTITIYQAYNRTISQSAIVNQTFICPPFKSERMTWIKPSFLWMMYRSQWATKENQEYILSIKIKRDGFNWALQNSCLSKFDGSIYPSYSMWKDSLKKSPVRIQWDPERDVFLQPLPERSLQMGLSGIALKRYISEWIVEIDDITDYCRKIHLLLKNKELHLVEPLLPNEKNYPIPKDVAVKIISY